MKKLIIANWKMNPTSLEQAKTLFDSIKQKIGDLQNTEIIICPPFIYLHEIYDIRCRTSKIKLGSQDCFWEQIGAFTGEISPKMLKSLGCEYVILGHSERRQCLNETDEMINKKLKAALRIGLKPILCIGDKNRASKKDDKDIQSQLEKGILGLKESDLEKIIIVYEPIWAISSKNGKAATLGESKQGLLFLKQHFENNFKTMPKILYGGSVDSGNISAFLGAEAIDGVLVGGAGLIYEEFSAMVDTLKS